ncbi:phosphatase PAP2 family protein [Glutamicibacter endophyticus]|uniref:phosphatase PAP2 family protein n=1 Tax=Glutamicibacter endophyticus TaxID=1522174 RepID=UPI003AEFF3D4
MRLPRQYPSGSRSVAAKLLWIVFGIVVVMVFFTRRVLVSLRAGGWSHAIDEPVYQWVLEHQVPWAHWLATLFHYWGSTPGMTLTMVLITVALCWWQRNLWPLATTVVTALGSVLCTIVLKAQLLVVRPGGVPGGVAPPETFSFPSGHTLNAAALIGISAYLAIVLGWRHYAKWIGIGAGIFVICMGLSRIYLGHHWVSDVVVGLTIGVGWAAVVAILHFNYVPRPASLTGPGQRRTR